jgi:hypothetical protein
MDGKMERVAGIVFTIYIIVYYIFYKSENKHGPQSGPQIFRLGADWVGRILIFQPSSHRLKSSRRENFGSFVNAMNCARPQWICMKNCKCGGWHAASGYHLNSDIENSMVK